MRKNLVETHADRAGGDVKNKYTTIRVVDFLYVNS
jgi:hypothetical protein